MSPVGRLRKKTNAFVNGLSPSLFKQAVHTAILVVIIIQLTILIWCLDAYLPTLPPPDIHTTMY